MLIVLGPFCQKAVPSHSPTTFQSLSFENYNQACRIRDLSANASAAMSRRCVQGMIRDFWKISKGTLAKEIDILKKQVDEGKGPRGQTTTPWMPLAMSGE